MSKKVHVVLQNGAVAFVVDSKEKVLYNMKAAMCDKSHINIIDSDDKKHTVTVDSFVEMMYDLGSIGSHVVVTSTEMLEAGDQEATFSAFECVVE